jgi:esterase/lipase
MKKNMGYYPSLLTGRTAVSLVAHGLNQKPEAMLSLVSWLNSHGSDVYLINLSGHHQNSIAIKDVTSSVWHTEMLEGYQMARKTSLAASVPLYFLGYSLGALLGQSMVALSMENAPFDKQVLIAPAFAIRRRSYLIRFLCLFGKQRKLPSYTPEGYRVNESLPLLIYELLFTEERRIFKSKFRKLNIPTLVIIDPKDELISYKRLLKQINKFGLTNYRVVVLDQNTKDRDCKYHHLIIDERTMGAGNWKMVTCEMGKFLFEHSW